MHRFTISAVILPMITGAVGASWLPSGGANAGVMQFMSGGTDAEVTKAVNDFRAALGALNANNPQSFVGGRREVNWDGVPDSASLPNAFPGDFFNAAVAGRTRGIDFGTDGGVLGVNADSDNPTATPVDFANIDPSYLGQFRAFSGQRMFMPVESNLIATRFFLPGTTTPAAVSAFGVVFSDVDLATSTRLDFFDPNNTLIHSAFVPASSAGAEGFSFYGAQFDGGQLISNVVITSGTHALGAGVLDHPAGGRDLVVTDDFIYAEPVAVPTPGALHLLGAAGALLALRSRRR